MQEKLLAEACLGLEARLPKLALCEQYVCVPKEPLKRI